MTTTGITKKKPKKIPKKKLTFWDKVKKKLTFWDKVKKLLRGK